MARRVIEGQVDVFEVLREGNVGARPLPSAPKALPPSPKGEGLGEPARVLTLEALGGLEPFRSVVWIEMRPWATRRETEENAAYRFLLLFEAVFQTIGIPIGSERKHYHFKYTYTDGRNYEHHRVDEFYGQEWRVWDKRPTAAQREATPWLNMS